jgi:hypothetical protein
MMNLKNLVLKVVGDEFAGMLDYHRFPELRKSWEGPLNGQQFRKKIVSEVFDRFEFEAIVETGTYRGTTTEYLRENYRRPIYTVEHNRRLFGYVKRRFASEKDVHVFNDDSRPFLNALASSHLNSARSVFIYLDAHWDDDLPLREEIEISFKAWPKAVILIDDFQVPGDDGYGFDAYSSENTLSVSYLKKVGIPGIECFFPSGPSAEETGLRRGCVVLATDPECVQTLKSMKTLRGYSRET